jgi:hypothetical protein
LFINIKNNFTKHHNIVLVVVLKIYQLLVWVLVWALVWALVDHTMMFDNIDYIRQGHV